MLKLKENPDTENIGTKWTEDEINNLLNEIKENISFNDIALKHKRTLGSIKGKLYNIAEHYINQKKMNVNDVSKIVNIPVIKINDYLLKKLPKKESELAKETSYINTNLEILQNIKEEKHMPIVLNTEQQLALDYFKKGKNIFLTGPAGTGKSVTLREIIKYCEFTNTKLGVTATTGTAAFLISGKTLHSYLGIGLAKDSAEDIFKYVRYKLKHIADKLRDLSVIIIDEISMLDKELFEKISDYLKLIRKSTKPFGGLQLVLTGDFCQLEPVDGEFCFKSELWNTLNLKTIYLHKLIRQDGDKEFQKMLSQFRYGLCSDKNYKKLISLKNTSFGDVKPTKLYARNIDVDKINKLEYDKLIASGAEMKKYNVVLPQLSKNKERAEKWIQSLELPPFVELCVGAQVILLVNQDQDAGLVNGTRGVVVELKNKSVMIKKVNGLIFEIPYHKSTNVEDETLTAQYMPLKLAYALTIHKSQGSTLDAIEIDIGNKIFAAGQAYTALSRAQNLNSVKIVNVSKNSFIANQEVLNFYKVYEDELKQKNNDFVNSVLNMVIYNLANHIALDNTLDFIWEFISGDDEKTLDFFDNYSFDKLKLDHMNYSLSMYATDNDLKDEPTDIKTDEDRINKLINMVYKTKKYMLYDVEIVIQKIDEFELN